MAARLDISMVVLMETSMVPAMVSMTVKVFLLTVSNLEYQL